MNPSCVAPQSTKHTSGEIHLSLNTRAFCTPHLVSRGHPEHADTTQAPDRKESGVSTSEFVGL